MNQPSISSVNHLRFNSINFTINFVLKAAFSSSSSTLQTLTDPATKSVSNPFYNLLPHTQNPNNIVNLICASLKQDKPSLTHVHKDIQQLIPYLGSQEISRVLLRCQSDSFAALTFFNWVKNGLGLKPNAHNYCLIVHILAWSRNYPQAMKLLSELIVLDSSVLENVDVFRDLVLCTDECSWDPVVFDMLIKAYVKVDMIREGFRTFRRMVKFKFVPNVMAVNCLLNGLSRFNYGEKCWEIYEDMGRIGIRPNSYTFNILTNVFCKAGNVDNLKEFVEKMEEEGFDPDIVTYNTLIDSYCKKGRLKDARYLFRIMHIRGVIPDLVTHTALINGLCKEGNVKEAHQLFHQMVHRGLRPDVVLYNTLINGYCKEGMMQDARFLLHEMIGNNLFPDSFTCWTLVEGYKKESRLLPALNLVVELQRCGVSVSRDIYEFLIVALCREGRPFAAKSLLGRMPRDGNEPNVEVYNELIDSLCKCNFGEEAILLKAEMVYEGIKPNIATFRAIIGCLCRLSRSMDGETLMRELVNSSVFPDIVISRALINGHCNERNICKAESLLSFFAEKFQMFDMECYNTIVKVLHENGEIAKLMEFQDRMLKVGFEPTSLTCKYMIGGLWRAMGVDKKQSPCVLRM
ncbi:hypothetical protein RJ640_011020 [Escallonia rubra]|uniref:Pentatricopeptide repeat-containing protein n=1 Tax=Escallonia rubra TaxID=112253 RepID=A0AA88RPY0_9ASTE|nr:hypothetical protein RJ640_011020 [Escallonia rubra]